ncbi:transporter [Niabella ginsenosidivorans]|uniref:Transporter n=1 Tax=Niabella ginsenosidivorans TaxID=1176587 RepID=A0A1A9I3G7_9BACT|nr:TolC family protein [Niabella ginsenosidivorans]ANH81599.1 transporter [Niabella ginsenosidivorans]
MKRILLALAGFLALAELNAQEKWSLERCVQYAIEHNISVKQADVQARINKLTLEQSKMALYPTANSQHNVGYQFGRSIDPTSNQFTTNEILAANHSLNLNADIFNWFKKKNTIAANAYSYQAGIAQLEKARNDISLNVANAYLSALLAKEQINAAAVQVGQSRDQRNDVDKQVKAGALPELNLAEMETQLANDSATLINARANFRLNLLQLQALLNLDAAASFDIDAPPVDSIPVEPLAELEPDVVFHSALYNLPQQKINELNVKAAEKNVLVAKADMYPTIGLFGGLDTRYSNAQKLLPTNFQNGIVPVGFVNINGTNYIVNTEENIPMGFNKNTYFRQLSNNFSQNIGLGINIPIFNGNMARTNWKKAKLNVEAQQLQLDQDQQQLKQDIYQAHTNAVAAIEKYNASKIALASAQKAYDFARKRFDVGLLKPIDLIVNQNNLFTTKINMLSAHYDYVFKIKLLEFYKGQGIKLHN